MSMRIDVCKSSATAGPLESELRHTSFFFLEFSSYSGVDEETIFGGM